MPSGRCGSFAELPPASRATVADARRAVLATLDAEGRPHMVPITFAIAGDAIVTAIDQKPKGAGRPARLRNVERTPLASVLFDRYEDDWRRLAWVLARGPARIEPPGTLVDGLVERYEQYAADPPRGEVIIVEPIDLLWWSYE
jgi:PPOX class probable F420-dependent enzyme